jgi:hypothetical protein
MRSCYIVSLPCSYFANRPNIAVLLLTTALLLIVDNLLLIIDGLLELIKCRTLYGRLPVDLLRSSLK